jgi:hypothetical protein
MYKRFVEGANYPVHKRVENPVKSAFYNERRTPNAIVSLTRAALSFCALFREKRFAG